jgi:hypothetical protein
LRAVVYFYFVVFNYLLQLGQFGPGDDVAREKQSAFV